jgi:hypothetical protein
MTTTSDSRARFAYVSYCRVVDHRSEKGHPLPDFDGLPAERQDAWRAAADAIWNLAAVATL